MEKADRIHKEIQAKKSTDQRFKELLGRFKNTNHFETKMNRKIGKIEKVSGTRTNLQTADNKYCTKKEFEDEFMKCEFTDNSKAKKYLKQFTDLFDGDGWLIIKDDKLDKIKKV